MERRHGDIEQEISASVKRHGMSRYLNNGPKRGKYAYKDETTITRNHMPPPLSVAYTGNAMFLHHHHNLPGSAKNVRSRAHKNMFKRMQCSAMRAAHVLCAPEAKNAAVVNMQCRAAEAFFFLSSFLFSCFGGEEEKGSM